MLVGSMAGRVVMASLETLKATGTSIICLSAVSLSICDERLNEQNDSYIFYLLVGRLVAVDPTVHHVARRHYSHRDCGHGAFQHGYSLESNPTRSHRPCL